MTQPLTREQRRIWRRIVLASYGFTDEPGSLPLANTRAMVIRSRVAADEAEPENSEPRTPVLGRSRRRGSTRKNGASPQ